MDQSPSSANDLPEEAQELVNRLFDMSRTGDLALIEYIKQGINPDMENQDGNTFLMLAAYSGHAPLVAALAEQGADVNRLNDRGQSPLAGAIFKKEDDVIDVLLAAGADPNAGHPTAVDSATMFGCEDLLDRLR